mgnify:CR=1 FL=1
MPKVKICGLKTLEDVEIVNKYLPEYVGFVFAPTKRFVTDEQALMMKQALAPQIQAVGVFVNEPIEHVLSLCSRGIIDVIQLHGDETSEYITEIKNRTDTPVIKAVRVQSSEQVSSMVTPLAEYMLFDTYKKDAYGGSGECFPLEILQKSLKKLENQGVSIQPFFLAGGLTPGNIEEVLGTQDCYCIDVSTGVETDGHKDEAKVRELIEKIRRYQKERSNQMEQKKGRYGLYGGQYIPETLIPAVNEVEKAYEYYKNDPQFKQELHDLLTKYAGRPSLLYYAEKMTKDLGGAKIYLKREDLNHTGSHKINNVLGQVLLAKKMGKTRVIAETGAGQHGVATATGAALFDMECTVFMGEEDMERQALNVFRMEMLGTKVECVKSGSRTLKDATNEAIRTWAKNAEDTFYIIGSAVGPHPYPQMVKEFQRVISVETKKQILEKEGRLPDCVLACVGGGSNSIGMFAEFIDEKDVELIGVEAAGFGIETGKHASAFASGKAGVLHGMRSYLLQDDDGNIQIASSISAGLDYPGVRPEHAYLHDSKRATYVSITDDEAMQALKELCREEGIIPAIESAHAIAYALKKAKTMNEDQIMVVNLSGRGDKDVYTIAEYFKEK